MADLDEDTDGTPDCEEHELSREELLALNPFELRNFSQRKVRYMAAFDVEKWATQLEDFSFPTASAQVTWGEGVALQHFYQEGCCGHKAKVTDSDRLALEQLRGKIAALAAELAPRCRAGQGFFVRMGPRSPKDAPMMVAEPWGLSETRLRAALEEATVELEASREGRGGEADAHEVHRRFQRVCYSLLRVTTADDAIRLLVSSSRVMEDVSHTMDHGKSGWDMSVSLRAWDSEVTLDREFRCFVVGGDLAALSQYDDQLRYDFVVQHSTGIVEAIRRSLERLRPTLAALGLASAGTALVVDFHVAPAPGEGPGRTGTGELIASVVELNPFGPATGSSLFAWTVDRRTLQRGLDLYGDLADCERQHPPGSLPRPPWVAEEVVSGMPFRYLTSNRPGFTHAHLESFWPDYLRLAPPGLIS